MKRYLEIKKSHKGDKKSKDKEKKHKRKEKDSERKQKKGIEEMRKERLRREQEEHERERKLLASVRGDKKAVTDTTDYDAPHRYRQAILHSSRNISTVNKGVCSWNLPKAHTPSGLSIGVGLWEVSAYTGLKDLRGQPFNF